MGVWAGGGSWAQLELTDALPSYDILLKILFIFLLFFFSFNLSGFMGI